MGESKTTVLNLLIIYSEQSSKSTLILLFVISIPTDTHFKSLAMSVFSKISPSLYASI